MPLTPNVRAATRVPFVQVAKTAVAAVLAWFIPLLLLPGELPVFAVVAALIVIQPSVNQTYAKAFERSLGVLLGVLIALGAVLVFGEHSWLVLVATVVAIFAGWGLRLTAGSANQIAISAMLVLSIGAATPAYAATRVVETVIGAVIALIVNAAIAPPLLTAPARLAVARLARAEADRLDELATTIDSDPDEARLQSTLTSARELRALRVTAIDAVQQGRESLTFNPRRSRHREQLQRDADLLARLDPLVTRIVGMARTVHDQWDDDLVGDPLIAGVAEELRRAAHDLRRLVRYEDGSPGRLDDERPDIDTDLPALTRPIAILQPHPEHWVLLGALLEDLRRIREEIVGE
ncbi:aromatic acid exporter family protein [Amnibacterium flavum]|uniref:Integral membrane bound transporter domain-containing protein n=1 Tax=Amnibacterium flavum TaxID=2173173 RepID=A0A2V1HNF3_9MICO|nr:FUSC family protein [Amnibacterium flavum]PVZ94078.1 hypothetical protein DDQ50_10015 [Amnibacterium flavum]